MIISKEAAGGLFTFGVLMIYVEFFFPRFAQMNPLGRWFNSAGPQSSRVARLFGALSCMLFALQAVGALRWISDESLFAIWLVFFFGVGVHDISLYGMKKQSESSVKESKVQSPARKRRER